MAMPQSGGVSKIDRNPRRGSEFNQLHYSKHRIAIDSRTHRGMHTKVPTVERVEPRFDEQRRYDASKASICAEVQVYPKPSIEAGVEPDLADIADS